MQFEKEDIIKINGIELHARNDDWGQSGKKSDNQVLLTDESSSQATNCQLDAVDFRIEAYYVAPIIKRSFLNFTGFTSSKKTCCLNIMTLAASG